MPIMDEQVLLKMKTDIGVKFSEMSGGILGMEDIINRVLRIDMAISMARVGTVIIQDMALENGDDLNHKSSREAYHRHIRDIALMENILFSMTEIRELMLAAEELELSAIN